MTKEQKLEYLFKLLDWCEDNDYEGLIQDIVKVILELTQESGDD